MPKIRRKDPVAELLGTNNKNEQAGKIQQLIQLANSPVICVVCKFDARSNRITVDFAGDQVPYNIATQILAGAQNYLHQRELAEVKSMQPEVQNVPEETLEENDGQQNSESDRHQPPQVPDASQPDESGGVSSPDNESD